MASGQLELSFGEVVGVHTTVCAVDAVVIDLLKTHDDRVTDSGRVDRCNGADFVEPVGLWTSDAHLGSAGDRHRWA